MSRIFSTLQTALLIPFVGVVVLVALSVSLLSYHAGLHAVDELSEQLLVDISSRVTQATSRHLAHSAVSLNALVPDVALDGGAGSLVPETLPEFERRMWVATNLLPSGLSYLYYGSTAGEFVGLRRDEDLKFELRLREAGATGRTAYRTLAPGQRGEALRTDRYDPRSRPWFVAASRNGKLSWSDVYVDYTSRALTITLAKPVMGAAGVQRGVVAVDTPLAALDEFVRSLQVSPTGVAFIVERDGSLIATTTAEKLFGDDPAHPTRLHADQSASALIRQAWAQLRSADATAGRRATAGNAAIPTMSRYAFDGENGRTHMSATAQRDDAGLDWTMVVAVPRADYMSNVRRTVLQNLAIGLIAVVLAIAVGLWIMRRVTGDVRRLSEATRLLARGQSPEQLFAGRIDELGVIARAMDDFRDGLLNDALTGVLTRAAFEKRVTTQMAIAAYSRFAIVFIDLDRFKQVNDQYGHAVGDAVLAVSAQRIQSALRSNDLIARYGGDEFVLMLEGIEDDEVLDGQIKRLMTVLDQPVALAGAQVSAGGSCGGALYPRDGVNLDQLIEVADGRMYGVKKQRSAPA